MKLFVPLRFQSFCILIGLSIASVFALKDVVIAQQTCVSTDNGEIVCGRLVQNNPQRTTSAPDSSKKVEDNDFTFELQSCRRSGESIRCNLLIKNIGDSDRKLWISSTYAPASRIISSSGDEFVATTAQLGQQRGNSWAELQLIRGIPIKAVISFDNVPRNIDNMKVLEIGYGFYVPSNANRSIQFRDVKVQPK